MLEQKIAFSLDDENGIFHNVPAAPAVFLLRGDGEPYAAKTANLRRRLQRLLGPPAPGSKRLNLRSIVREIEFTQTASEFETQFLLYKVMRATFPKTYSARLRLRPAPLVKLHLENQYPRASVTTRMGATYWIADDSAEHPHNLYYGPFQSRAAAEKFASDSLDFFKMRRCIEDLNPDPAFPGCVYSEMKMCLAPCFEGCTDTEYQNEVGRVQKFFDTAGESLERELKEHRERASADLAFEEAASIHSKIEKLKPVLMQLAEIVQRLDRLDALIIQPGATSESVCIFRFRGVQFAGPVELRIENRSVADLDNTPTTPNGKPRTMESRVEELIGSFPETAALSTAERTEHLAILKRWYYRSHRIGEIFFADAKGSWPLRRIVRGIGRVSKGEMPDSNAPTKGAASIEAAQDPS